VRTALEDRELRRRLPGYADYAARVRWRLIPGVW
jgi:protein-S-isoprenylcysteine O-methyltransferase Ste14